MRRPPSHRTFAIVAAVAAWSVACGGDPAAREGVDVAVAANFAPVARDLATAFEDLAGSPVRLAVGSTGGLTAQVVAGAPFHVLLAADTVRPAWLVDEGRAVAGSRFTYAVGRLVVHAPDRTDAWTLPDLLREPGLRVAWADPRTAPYGAAARSALEAWGLGDLEGVVGESVGQTWQFVRSGAVDAAFVAAAQVRGLPPATVRAVPDSLHPPLRQDAVLLTHGAEHPPARAFLDFVRGAEARAIIREAGYDLVGGAGDGL